jgi:GNAT superfamily N-acetyltransferase
VTRVKWTPRLASEEDIPSLEELVPLSVRTLQASHYSPAQMEAALGPVFGVDRQLIRDRTYFVVENAGQIVGCGGWSKRRSLFGGDLARSRPDAELDPAREPARIRAFFVHPGWARKGIGRSILQVCEEEVRMRHFRSIDLVATLAGVPLYAAFGYAPVQRYEIDLVGNLRLPVVRMTKGLEPHRVTIRPLADVPEAIPLLARWFYTEWHSYDGRSLAAIEAQLVQNLARDSIPITFVAQSGSALVGTVSLDLSDLPLFDHLSHWLTSLYVLPAVRGAGIGSALVHHAQKFATSLGIKPLYLWTPGSARIYESCGWTVSRRTMYNSRPITLMSFSPWENSTNP